MFIDPVVDALALPPCNALDLALRLDEPLTSPFLKRMIVTTHCTTSTRLFVPLFQHCSILAAFSFSIEAQSFGYNTYMMGG